MKLPRMNQSGTIKTLVNVVEAFGIKAAGAGFSIITSVIISRTFSASGTGIYSLSNSILQIATIIAKFGFDLALIKYISIDYENGFHEDLRKKLRTSLFISAGISILLIIIVLLSQEWISRIFVKPDLNTLLPIMIVVTLPSAMMTLISSGLKGVNKVKTGLFFESAAIPIVYCVSLVVLVFIIKRKALSNVGWALLFTNIFVFLIILLYWRLISKSFNKNKSNSYQFEPVIKTARPLLLVNSTNYILGSTDIIMLGLWVSSSDVGIYNIATKITLLFSMLLSAVNALLGPKFAVLYQGNNSENLKQLVKRSSRAMLFAALLICTILLVFGKTILKIWGDEFITGLPVFYVSLAGQFFALATGPLATLLMMCGYEKIHRNNTLITACINVVLNYVLIHQCGILGAALATMISIVIKNSYCIFAVKKKFGFFCY